MSGLAGIVAAHGDPTDATTLFGAAAALREEIGVPVETTAQQRYERRLAAVRAELDTETFTAAWEIGSTRPPERALGVAFASAPSESEE